MGWLTLHLWKFVINGVNSTGAGYGIFQLWGSIPCLKSSNAIVAGDFNIDLLHINERHKYQKYFDVFVMNGLFPLITLPTRVSKHSCIPIYQLFCKLRDVRKLDFSGIIKTDLSDHFPYFTALDICKTVNHKPKFVNVNNNSESAFQSFSRISTSLENWNLNRNLFGDPNENYNMLENIILQAKSKCLSPKTVLAYCRHSPVYKVPGRTLSETSINTSLVSTILLDRAKSRYL